MFLIYTQATQNDEEGFTEARAEETDRTPALLVGIPVLTMWMIGLALILHFAS